MHPRTLLACTLLAACGPAPAPDGGDTTGVATDAATVATPTDTGAATTDCDGPPRLELTNDSPYTLTQVVFGDCASHDGERFPLLPGGLAPGASRTIDLPAPGCWFINIFEASGCELDPIPQTGELAACEAYALTVSNASFICPGG